MARRFRRRFRNLLDGGVGSPVLPYNLQLLAECALLRGKRHELFMPETHALRLGERSHGVHYGNFAFCDFVDLPYQPNDLRHLLPGFRVMASPQPFEVQPPAMTVAFPCPFIKHAELLQLPFVLLFEWLNLRVRTDEVVRRGEVRVFDVRDLPSEPTQIGLRAFELAQHFFLVPVPHYERDSRSGDTNHKNDDRHDRVSPNSLLFHRLRHDVTEAYRVFTGLQNAPSTILHQPLANRIRGTPGAPFDRRKWGG